MFTRSTHLPPPRTTSFKLHIDKKPDRRTNEDPIHSSFPTSVLDHENAAAAAASHTSPMADHEQYRRGSAGRRLRYPHTTIQSRISRPPPPPSQVPTHHDPVAGQQDTAATASGSHTPISDDDAYGGKQCRASSLISFQPCFLKGTYSHDLLKITQRYKRQLSPDGAICNRAIYDGATRWSHTNKCSPCSQFEHQKYIPRQ